MPTAQELNSLLAREYVAALGRWKQSAAMNREAVSKPLLLSVPDEYTQARCKLLVVGQETLGWGEKRSLDVADLMQEYDAWALGTTWGVEKKIYRSPFWDAARQLYRSFNGTDSVGGYLWSNLVKVDESAKRASAPIEDAISALSLLQKEIKIAQPDVVVFFTGPNYDGRLRTTFPGIVFEPTTPSRATRCLATLRHPLLPARSYRIYHPGYLRRKNLWPVLDDLARAANEIQS